MIRAIIQDSETGQGAKQVTSVCKARSAPRFYQQTSQERNPVILTITNAKCTEAPRYIRISCVTKRSTSHVFEIATVVTGLCNRSIQRKIFILFSWVFVGELRRPSLTNLTIICYVNSSLVRKGQQIFQTFICFRIRIDVF